MNRPALAFALLAIPSLALARMDVQDEELLRRPAASPPPSAQTRVWPISEPGMYASFLESLAEQVPQAAAEETAVGRMRAALVSWRAVGALAEQFSAGLDEHARRLGSALGLAADSIREAYEAMAGPFRSLLEARDETREASQFGKEVVEGNYVSRNLLRAFVEEKVRPAHERVKGDVKGEEPQGPEPLDASSLESIPAAVADEYRLLARYLAKVQSAAAKTRDSADAEEARSPLEQAPLHASAARALEYQAAVLLGAPAAAPNSERIAAAARSMRLALDRAKKSRKELFKAVADRPGSDLYDAYMAMLACTRMAEGAYRRMLTEVKPEWEKAAAEFEPLKKQFQDAAALPEAERDPKLAEIADRARELKGKVYQLVLKADKAASRSEMANRKARREFEKALRKVAEVEQLIGTDPAEEVLALLPEAAPPLTAGKRARRASELEAAAQAAQQRPDLGEADRRVRGTLRAPAAWDGSAR